MSGQLLPPAADSPSAVARMEPMQRVAAWGQFVDFCTQFLVGGMLIGASRGSTIATELGRWYAARESQRLEIANTIAQRLAQLEERHAG